MDNKKGSVSHVLHTRYHFKYKLVVEGILCGAFAGMIAIVYRILLSSCEQFLSFLSIYIKEHVFAFIQWFVAVSYTHLQSLQMEFRLSKLLLII